MSEAVQDPPFNAPWLFTSETARINALKRHEANRAKAASVQPVSCDATEQTCDASLIDPLAKDLSRVQAELVAAMKGNKDAKAVSALAMALKNVRETYHLVTGQAKPGVIRETKPRGRRDSKAYSQPTPVEDQTPQGKTYDGPENG